MAYYALSEREYERIIECLKGIRQGCEGMIKRMALAILLFHTSKKLQWKS